MGDSITVQWLVGISFCVAFGFGCGSSNKSPQTAAPITSVDESKALSALSADEMQKLCTDFEKYLVDQTAQEYAIRSCIQAALGPANRADPSQASQVCHTQYDSCINDPTNPKDSAGISISGLCPTTPSAPSCSLTVSQYEECLRDLSTAANAIWTLQNDLCDNLTSCSGNCNGSMTLPASCQLVNTTCPGIGPQVIAYITVTS